MVRIKRFACGLTLVSALMAGVAFEPLLSGAVDRMVASPTTSSLITGSPTTLALPSAAPTASDATLGLHTRVLDGAGAATTTEQTTQSGGSAGLEKFVVPASVERSSELAHETATRIRTLALERITEGEGAKALGVDAWRRAGLDGAGTTLAIIDTGYADWATVAAAGRVHPFSSLDLNYCDAGFERTNHGTATAEILWDMAPAVDLVRVCIDDTADLALAVPRLIAERVDVVNMSLGFYNTGPGDGSGGPGSPDHSVRQALAAGLLWVNSAGNEADAHAAFAFADANGNSQGEWAPGDEAMTFVLPPSGAVDVYVKWNDWVAPSNDFALCLTDDPALTPDCFPSRLASTGTPTVSIGLANPFDRAVPLHASLVRRTGTASVRIDAFFVGTQAVEHPTAEVSLAEPAAVEGVVSVGAVCLGDGVARPTSSQGPTLDGRPGITVAAPGSVSSSVFGATVGCAGGYDGTSAAAPHVAGALALIRQGSAYGSNGAARSALVGLAQAAGDPGSPGVDPVYGVGRLNLGSPPPVSTSSTSTTSTSSPSTSLPSTSTSTSAGTTSTTSGPFVDSGGFALAQSPAADRASATPLRGATLQGDVFVHLTPVWPTAPVSQVRFFAGNRLLQVEKSAGYDLGGGQSGFGYAFDTWRLADGTHLLRAEIAMADGRRFTVTEPVVVANGGGARPGPVLEVRAADAGGERPLDGATVAGPLRLSLAGEPGAAVNQVLFYVDADLIGYDDTAPYDNGVAINPARLGVGPHQVQVIVFFADGRYRTANATFATAS